MKDHHGHLRTAGCSVHGGFVDGSGWQGVYESLSRDGFPVSIVQNPALSLQGDVEAIQQIIDAQDGPVVLARHSYGGAVITEAWHVIAAFAPDKGESVSTLIAGFPAGGPQPPTCRPGTASCSWSGTNSTHRSPRT